MFEDNENALDFINFDDVESGPPLLPADKYPARIVEAEVRDSKSAPGEKHINYAAVVTDGPYAGRRVYGIWSLKAKNLWRMKRDLKYLGYEPVVPSTAEMIGLEGTMNVALQVKKINGQDTDEMENRIKGWVNS